MKMAALVVVIAVLQLCAHVASSKPAPHIVYILTDNLGYGGVNFLRRDTANGSSPEVVTPNLDALADSGVILASFYTYKVGPAPGQSGAVGPCICTLQQHMAMLRFSVVHRADSIP